MKGALLALLGAAAAYTPGTIMAPRAVRGRAGACRMQEAPLRAFLLDEAGVSSKFVDAVLDVCDEEMIDSTRGLRVAHEAGLLGRMFKPVVRIGIERALGLGPPPDVSAAVEGASALLQGPTVPVPTSLLEVEPYHDVASHLPLNTYKQKKPHTAKIVSVKRIVGPAAPGEVCHVQIASGPTFRYWEGQSLGVIPPGENPKAPGKPNLVRLYSIASTRYGDDLDGNTVSLCVRRAVYWCPERKAEDPAKKGVCSNFLCDAKPGTEVTMTGPTGKVMLMPEHTPDADIIMVATGTGIAPCMRARPDPRRTPPPLPRARQHRSTLSRPRCARDVWRADRGFLRRLFLEETPAAAAFTGLAWLVLGVPVTQGLLYDDDWQEIAARKPDNFRLTYAISREQATADGSKMYVQDRLAEQAEVRACPRALPMPCWVPYPAVRALT
jgi:ferredoxin--NADP+ reductase